MVPSFVCTAAADALHRFWDDILNGWMILMEYGLTHEPLDDKRLKDSRPAMARRIMRSRETGEIDEIFVWESFCF